MYMYALYHIHVHDVDARTSQSPPWFKVNSYTPGTVLCLKLRDSYYCEYYKDIYKRKEKKKERTGLFLAFTICLHCDSAPGTVIARRKILITILSISKQKWPQSPPYHIKPITFGNE